VKLGPAHWNLAFAGYRFDRERGGGRDGGPQRVQEGRRGRAAQGEGNRRLCAEGRKDRLQAGAIHISFIYLFVYIYICNTV